jgi:hypothetical protein
MKLRVIGSTLALLAFGVLVAAQQPPAPPKPGPEHKPLGFFVGKWKGEGEVKEGPLGPAGKFTSTDSCDWFGGGFHVVCNGTVNGPMGKMSVMGVMGYSAADKAYTNYGLDSLGTGELSKGQKKGNVWTFTATSNFAGQTFQSRYTLTETSPTSYTFKWEASQDKKTWAVALEGKATKN